MFLKWYYTNGQIVCMFFFLSPRYFHGYAGQRRSIAFYEDLTLSMNAQAKIYLHQ